MQTRATRFQLERDKHSKTNSNIKSNCERLKLVTDRHLLKFFRKTYASCTTQMTQIGSQFESPSKRHSSEPLQQNNV